MVHLKTLGEIDLRHSDGREALSVVSQPKRLTLLAYLAVEASGRFVQRDRLADLFWPEHNAVRARANLRKALSYLRRALGADIITTRGDHEVGVDPERIWCDARAMLDGRLSPSSTGLFLDAVHISGTAHDFDAWVDSVRARLRQCHRMFKEKSLQKGLRLDLTLAPDVPCLQADPRLIRQSIINLLSNAIKFTADGGQVRSSVSVNAGGELVISVADTGIGIAAADIANVVQPFVQVESAMSREHEGTGLGLPLVKKFTELHDGRFAIESELGKGTTVTLIFPTERVREADKPMEIQATRFRA